MIADGTVTAEQLRTFEASSQAWQDEMWTRAAEEDSRKAQAESSAFSSAHSG